MELNWYFLKYLFSLKVDPDPDYLSMRQKSEKNQQNNHAGIITVSNTTQFFQTLFYHLSVRVMPSI